MAAIQDSKSPSIDVKENYLIEPNTRITEPLTMNDGVLENEVY